MKKKCEICSKKIESYCQCHPNSCYGHNHSLIGASNKKYPENKYTVKEVIASLYWSVTDCDEDFDGNLHLISTLNGSGMKIPLIEILGKKR